MPFTEVAIPPLKSSPEDRKLFLAEWPDRVNTLKGAEGGKKLWFGWMALVDEVNVEDDFRGILLIEWDEATSFFNFIHSPVFKEFATDVQPRLSGPPSPEVYETDFEPATVAKDLTEVIRVQYKEDASLSTFQSLWADFTKALKQEISGADGTDLPSISGPSLNLEEKKIVGIVSWDSLEARQTIMAAPNVRAARLQLEKVGPLTSFVVKLELQFSH